MWFSRLFVSAAIAAALVCPPASDAQQRNRAVFRKAISAATAPASSGSLPNIGQVMHIVTVIFPSAAAAVDSFDVRLEGSYDNAAWFPIAHSITAAPRLGNITYQIQVAFGPYPFLRVRSLTGTAEAMDVWYSGQTQATVSAITVLQDRFIL